MLLSSTSVSGVCLSTVSHLHSLHSGQAQTEGGTCLYGSFDDFSGDGWSVLDLAEGAD